MPTPSIFMFWIPAALMAVNNFLTTWDLARSLGFGGLVVAGILARSATKTYNSLFVQCIQVDPQIKYLYIVLQPSILTSSFNKYKLPEAELEGIINNYHPVKLEFPNTTLSTKGIFAQMQTG